MFLAFIVMSCNNDLMEAEESLEGAWDIIRIESFYGEFSETTFNSSEMVVDSGELGSFLFTQNFVEFNFTRNDTLFSGNSQWAINHERIREGFFRTNEFTLTIQDQFVFDVTFGDDTRNAERNASAASFITKPGDDSGLYLVMSLDKR